MHVCNKVLGWSLSKSVQNIILHRAKENILINPVARIKLTNDFPETCSRFWMIFFSNSVDSCNYLSINYWLSERRFIDHVLKLRKLSFSVRQFYNFDHLLSWITSGFFFLFIWTSVRKLCAFLSSSPATSLPLSFRLLISLLRSIVSDFVL